jgi:hypothetical protein
MLYGHHLNVMLRTLVPRSDPQLGTSMHTPSARTPTCGKCHRLARRRDTSTRHIIRGSPACSHAISVHQSTEGRRLSTQPAARGLRTTPPPYRTVCMLRYLWLSMHRTIQASREGERARVKKKRCSQAGLRVTRQKSKFLRTVLFPCFLQEYV